MDKRGMIELSVRWIVRIVLAVVFLILFIGFLIGFSKIIPVFIIGLLVVGLVIEVLWKIMAND